MTNAFMFDGRTLGGPFTVSVANASMTSPGVLTIHDFGSRIKATDGVAQLFIPLPNRSPGTTTVVFVIEYANGLRYCVAKTVDANLAGQYVLAVPNPATLQKSTTTVYGMQVGGTEPVLRQAIMDWVKRSVESAAKVSTKKPAEQKPVAPSNDAPPLKNEVFFVIDGKQVGGEFNVAPAFFIGGERQLDVKAPVPSTKDGESLVKFPLAGTSQDFVGYVLAQYPSGEVYLTGYPISVSRPKDLHVGLPSREQLQSLPRQRAEDGTLLVADTTPRLNTLAQYWGHIATRPEEAVSSVEVAEAPPQAEPDDGPSGDGNEGNKALALLTLVGLALLASR